MKITHSPILYQGGGSLLPARTQLTDKAATAQLPRIHPGNLANNVPLEHGIEGQLLKARVQSHAQGLNGNLWGDFYHGESWSVGNSSSRRAIAMYQDCNQPHPQHPRHLIDIYA